jgi:hypothetical protein
VPGRANRSSKGLKKPLKAANGAPTLSWVACADLLNSEKYVEGRNVSRHSFFRSLLD